jgi:E3 ubiquitin-protein ligase RNF1/2
LTVEEVEILAVKGCSSANCDKTADEDSVLDFDELSSLVIDPQKDELEILQAHETVAEIRSKSIFKRGHLVSIKIFFFSFYKAQTWTQH